MHVQANTQLAMKRALTGGVNNSTSLLLCQLTLCAFAVQANTQAAKKRALTGGGPDPVQDAMLLMKQV